ncbi:MAG TPA: glycoside hydrolase family 27 protein [Candidatus Limnocylindria bacterium]|nr:glycoside hydrolase family 27 protein [Candidatus Limnocylindria bacterium]
MGIGRLADGLAATPPLGWNSWNAFGRKIDERTVLEAADALVATGMRDAGYRYLVIDDGWEAPERSAEGDLVADPATFPRGIRALADDVHARGLAFGIYTDAGTRTCQGLPASLGYEFRDARRFAEWGVDYVKVDWCHTDGLGPRALYAKWALAVHAAGRPMVLSICEWGRHRPWEWAPVLGHLWRTCWDIQASWESVMTIVARQSPLWPYAGPGHWNDPDMLEVGNGMSAEEDRTHVTLWAILAAPLMAGNDVRSMSASTRELLVAPEMLAIDQDPLGEQGRPLRDGVWARSLADGSRAVALVNAADAAAETGFTMDELGARRATVRDAWAREDVASRVTSYSTTLAPHASALLRVRAA